MTYYFISSCAILDHITNAATQEYIIRYNYKDHENGEEEYFKTSFFLAVSSS